VAPLNVDGQLRGYLYIILQGETFNELAASAWQKTLGACCLDAAAGGPVWSAGRRPCLVLGDAPGTPADRAGGDPGEDSIGAIKLLAAQAPEPHPGNEVAILHNRFIDLARQIAGQWDRLADSDRQRREFIANISHDLRTPLTSLLGYLETLTLKADRLSAEESKRYLNIALRQGIKSASFPAAV
jgi:signal transduction histidine kinase